MKSRNGYLVNSALKTAGDLIHANKQCWRTSSVNATRGGLPHTSTLGKTDRQIKSSSKWRCLNSASKISTSLCQHVRKIKTSPFPSPSACIQSMLKNQAKQNRKQLITNIMFLLMTIRTSHQCKIKHLPECSLMKSWPWKQRTSMKKCFAFKSSLVSKRGDYC